MNRDNYDSVVRKNYEMSWRAENERIKRERSLQEEIFALQEQYIPIADRAQYRGNSGTRHHAAFLANQIADNQTILNEMNGFGVVFSVQQLKTQRERQQAIIDEAQAQIDAMNQSVTAENVHNISAADFERQAEINLARRLELDAQIFGAQQALEALDIIEECQGRVHQDNTTGQFRANLEVAEIEQALYLGYNTYLNDPTEQNKEFVDSLENLLTQYKKNNKQALDDNYAEMQWFSKDFAGELPGKWEEWKAEVPGKIIGAIVSAVSHGVIPMDVAMDIGGSATKSNYMYATVRGMVYREMLGSGISEEEAMKIANNAAIMDALIEVVDTCSEVVEANKVLDENFIRGFEMEE